MDTSDRHRLLQSRLKTFNPNRFPVSRWLALYSAAVATADHDIMKLALNRGGQHLRRDDFYEIVLQSYLFLGFPRMLIAAQTLAEVHPPPADLPSDTRAISVREAADWFERGLRLYNQVYDDKADVLRHKVEGFAPEVFRWMVIEGYGKVLSRSGPAIVDRELSIVSFLMMDNREQQLISHLMGAVNVGASPEVIGLVVEDIGHAAEGYELSLIHI